MVSTHSSTAPDAAPVEGAEAPTVLVVDDSAIDRRVAGRLVEKDSGLRAVYAPDGLAALESIAQSAPAVVLTDLQMPGMDGLELVRTVRDRFPTVPVILMTGNGSEEIAIEALRSGAASYVPKRTLAKDLAATVEQVLNAARGDRRQQRLLGSFASVESRLELENDPSLVPALVAYLQGQATQMGACGASDRTRVGVALEEALLNGLYHGNLELSSDLRQDGSGEFERRAKERRYLDPYRDRRLHVTARMRPGEAVFVIRDEGPGFDPSTLPDPTDPANLERASGRGLLLIQAFMDAVSHNTTGNEITLTKRASSPE
ncbi:Adenylate cyclase 2 [Gemmata sp. SH-PL17]|uniref:response regulator n=1 Tax=Gemmata sp. SH-PL17 TaxID=1630693 RepID=UPI00078DE304|nr:response regulator [Gemmata sp. SH-PL17]AMV25280.1 Adenylate cyclase 2 [Gemmata sp. SH-PL17]